MASSSGRTSQGSGSTPPPRALRTTRGLARAAEAARRIICAWGVHGGEYPHDFIDVLRGPIADGRRDLDVLKLNVASRTPTHPLYLSYDLKPIEWSP